MLVAENIPVYTMNCDPDNQSPGPEASLQDVPSPIDLRLLDDARQWEAQAMSSRPWRTDFFEVFAQTIEKASLPVRRVLELGSGPGFLASHLLRRLPDVSYVALDFSPAMHQLARERLGQLISRVRFVERSFRDVSWTDNLGIFDAIVTNQAVHELRHKQHAKSIHEQTRRLLVPCGLYLVCDHFVGEGGMTNDQLYMTVEEQKDALLKSGFSQVSQVLLKGSLVLHQAIV
jgi:SAM-dependent methyltransferase